MKRDEAVSDVHALLAQDGEVTANATEGGSPSLTAKGAGDLLLDVGQTCRLLGAVVGQRHV